MRFNNNNDLKIVIIYENNQRVIALIKNPKSHNRIKYIDIINYFYRKKIVNKFVTFEYTSINKQIANKLIKILVKDKFKIFRDTIKLKQLSRY